jgi:hypothetical protein
MGEREEEGEGKMFETLGADYMERVFSPGWISTWLTELKLFHDWLIILHGKFLAPGWNLSTEPRELFRFFEKLFLSIIWFVRARLWLHLKVLKIVQTKIKPLKRCFFNTG